MRLSEIMSTDVETIAPGENGLDAFRRMAKSQIRHLVVVDKNRMAGILSSRDVPEGDPHLGQQTVKDLMSVHVATATPQTTVRQAANMLRGQVISCLPVLEGDRLVGIVTTTDLLEALGKGAQEQGTSGSSRFKPVIRTAHWPRVSRKP